MLRKRPEMKRDGYKAGDTVKGKVLHARYSRYMQKVAGEDAALVDELAEGQERDLVQGEAHLLVDDCLLVGLGGLHQAETGALAGTMLSLGVAGLFLGWFLDYQFDTKPRWILIGTVAASVASAIMFLSYIARWGALLGGFGGRDNRGGNPIGLLAAAIVAPIAALFIQMAISAPLAMLTIFILMLLFFRKLVLVISPMIVAMVSSSQSFGKFLSVPLRVSPVKLYVTIGWVSNQELC